MTAEPTARRRSLSAVLAESASLTLSEKLRIVGQLAESVSAIHAAGEIHRAISASQVWISPEQEWVLSPIEPRVRLGGEAAEHDLIPPDLRCSGPWHLPPDIAGVDKLLREAGLAYEPQRIDLFQLASLLCRVVADVSVDDYLRSPRAKGQIPLAVQRVIDFALGLDPARRYVDASELARDVKVLATAAERGIAEAKSRTDDSEVNDSQALQTTPASIAAFSETPRDGAAASSAVPLPGSGIEAPLPFTRLGHYRIESRIGCGGMGDVYKGFDESLQRVVAIKVLPPELARNAELVKRFYTEASSIAMLVHSSIIQIYFIGEDGGHHFFAMQYVDGESLGDLLHRKQRLGVEETVAICEQCLAGLSLAHSRGLVHRDIKPGNILLDRHYRRALLADFGLAKALDAGSQMTATGVIMGTLDYISPEQGRGLPVDGRSDLYSFGVLMYQALSGRVPFEADTATAMLFKHAYDPPPPLCEIAPDIPPALAGIVERLLAKSPNDRYPTADALLGDLKSFRAGQPLAVGSTARTAGGPRQTVMFRASALHEPPEVPAELLEPPEKPGLWASLGRRYQSLFRRHAPEFLKQLQGTQQQVDGAIAEYERRVNVWERDLQQGESVLADLNAQAGDCEAAAATAERDSDTEAEHRQRQSVAELRRSAEEQEGQLGLMRLNLAQARARLLNLRGQRDLLNARMKTAQAEAHLAGRKVAHVRLPLWQWIVIGPLVVIIALAGFEIVKRALPRSPQAAIVAPVVATHPVASNSESISPEFKDLPGINKMRDEPTCLAIVPGWGRRRIAVGYADGKVGVYEGSLDYRDQAPRVFQEPDPLPIGESPVKCLAFSNDGQ